MHKIDLNPGYLINGYLNNQVTRRNYCSDCSYISTEDAYNLCAIKCTAIFKNNLKMLALDALSNCKHCNQLQTIIMDIILIFKY